MWNWIKKHTAQIIISAFLVALIIWYVKRQRQQMADKVTYTEQDFINGLPVVISAYGKSIAQSVERIYRMETAHFKSVQFSKTGTPGMESHGVPPNYGWYAPFFLQHPTYTPLGTYVMNENQTGKQKTFIVMPSVEAAMMFLADYIKRYGNPARWYSRELAAQERYTNSLNAIVPRHTNNLA